MAVLRHLRLRVRNKFIHSTPAPMGSSMLSSSTSSSSTNSSSSDGTATMSKQKSELGIDGKTKNGAVPRVTSQRKQSPRFFFWTLSLGTDKKKGGNKGNKSGSVDSADGPGTPDSSRSVSFEDSESWPWIDDEENKEGILVV